MIELPSGVYPQSVSMALVDFGGTIRPVLGGAAQRVNRLGSRYRAIVSLPPLEFETGRTVVSRLIRAKSEGLRLALPGTRGQQGAPGTAVQVDGAVAGGTSLPLKGINPGYSAREGTWLSIVVSGQHYLYATAAQATADGTGDATVTIAPMLRTALAGNELVHVAAPVIEGFVDGDELAWELSLANHFGLSFTVEEAA